MKKENPISKIVTFVLGILLFSYIGYQVYRIAYNPVKTVSAIFAEIDDSVELHGIVIREETVMQKNYGSGVLEMNVYEGERVASGEAVAVVYNDSSAVERNRKSEELSEQIEQMTKLYSQSGESYDIAAANDKISDEAVNLLTMHQEGVCASVAPAVDELKMQTMVREYIYRDKSELLAVIDGLKEEKKKLGSGASVKKRIYSSSSGYFSQSTDGFEKVMTFDFIQNATPTEFSKKYEEYAMEESNAVGKLISTNKWYFAATVSENEAKRLKAGAIMKLKFADKILPEVSAEVERITEAENGQVLVVFSCNSHISSFTKIRKISAEAVIKTYSGLKVPREALRVSDEGVNGVYCLIDSQVKFKPVNIIFEKDSYYISEYDSADTKSLLLYDEIIVSAKNLENRKVVK